MYYPLEVSSFSEQLDTVFNPNVDVLSPQNIELIGHRLYVLRPQSFELIGRRLYVLSQQNFELIGRRLYVLSPQNIELIGHRFFLTEFVFLLFLTISLLLGRGSRCR